MSAAGCGSVPPPSPPNGCGPALGVSPPQGIGSANFGFACDRHDQCYGRLGAPKDGCDNQFGIELLTACGNARIDDLQILYETRPEYVWPEATVAIAATFSVCVSLGTGYANAVAALGSGRYASAQASSLCQSFQIAKDVVGCGST